ncbi:MAG: hypothetical protein KDA42_06070 [Planctomycetales bacterium]|nr:hypothetical protein [Planctomycetales bacterium]
MKCESEQTFHCPGERQPISRAVHLARLAEFYHACRDCPQRDETSLLSARRAEQLSQVIRRRGRTSLFDNEGLAGIELNEITPEVARRAAIAWGATLLESGGADASHTVLLARDSRSVTAELVEAAAEGLKRLGRDVLEAGNVTAPALVALLAEQQAAGALMLGNATDRAASVTLRFWNAAGRPLSAGHGLDAVCAEFDFPSRRRARRFGAAQRIAEPASYVAQLAKSYHALRSLRIGLFTESRAARSLLNRLTEPVDCRFVAPDRDDADAPSKLEDWHASVWVDGDGETCRVWDETGQAVSPRAFFLLLARRILSMNAGATLLVEQEAEEDLDAAIERLGGRAIRSDSKRETMFTAMQRHGAVIGGGATGRFWFPTPLPCPDALEAITALVCELSLSDRRLSQHVTDAMLTRLP